MILLLILIILNIMISRSSIPFIQMACVVGRIKTYDLFV